MPNEIDESVIEPGSQTGDAANHDSPDENAQGTEREPQEQEARRDNRIPHSRVEEMIAQRLEKARKEWEEKDLNPLRQSQAQMIEQFQNAEKARLRALGLLQDEQPKSVTMDVFEKHMKELREEFSRQQAYQYHGMRLQQGWEYAESKYKDLTKHPAFGRILNTLYSEDPQKHPRQIVDELAKWILGSKKPVATPDSRIVPAGRGSASNGSQQDGKGKKLTVADKIKARLAASRGNNDEE